jgi:hypothetical protein
MPLGNEGLTAAKFDINVRAIRGTVMGQPVNNPSTESDFYVGLPSGINAEPVGVLMQDVVEPGYPMTSELWLDPTTNNPINGSTPPAPFVPQGRAWALCMQAAEVEYIAADTTIAAGDDLVIADAYGRVTSVQNNATITSGTKCNSVGVAKYPAGAANQRIRGSFMRRQVTK